MGLTLDSILQVRLLHTTLKRLALLVFLFVPPRQLPDRSEWMRIDSPPTHAPRTHPPPAPRVPSQ
jgi:hypothetical protein